MKKIRIVIVEDLEEVAEGLSEFISWIRNCNWWHRTVQLKLLRWRYPY
jgi:hypothetical protein